MSDFRKNFFITLGVVILAACVFLGVFLYLFLGIISPLSGEFRLVQENIKIAEERIADFKGRVAPALLREEADMVKIEKSFFVYSPDTAKEFIIFLENASARNNLKGDIGSLPQATSPIVTMNLSGSFRDIITFLREIENGPLLLAINSVSLRGAGESIALSIQMRLPVPPQGSQ
ncbi:MAG: hypothetical protein AAB367_01575 [Patescibacteria group bacterium]